MKADMRTPEKGLMRVVLWAILLVAAGCGGSGDTDSPTTAERDDPAESATTAAGNGNDEAERPLDSSTLEALEHVTEVTTSDGAVILVGIDCDSQIGGQLLHVATLGLPETGDLYTAEVEPGGSELQFSVPPGQQARQMELDGVSYTVTLPEVDDGLELTVDGCGS